MPTPTEAEPASAPPPPLASAAAAEAPIPVPTGGLPLGPWRLVQPIGRGAMGAVWRGHRLHQDRPVAIKLVVGRSSAEPWARASFLNEVRAAAGLNHPGVVAVLDHGEVDAVASAASGGQWPVGSPYLVMEFVDGRPLHDLVGRLPWTQLKDVLEQLLAALAHSHARRVVHRDIKPGNVLVRSADAGPLGGGLRVQLTDFGLARMSSEDSGLERTIAGTPAYMAPEQLRGNLRDQDTWTDLYSVGCLAWALCAGAPPFGRRRPLDEFLADHAHRQPPPLVPMMGVPASFEGWLRRLLCKRPFDRYTTAADALDALRHLPDDGARLSSPVPPVRGEDDLSVDDLVSGGEAAAALLGDAQTGGAVRGLDDSTFDLPVEGESGGLALAAEAQRFPLALRTRAPFPQRWEADPKRLRGPSSAEAIRLFGLRRAPLFGRAKLRGALIEAWRTAEASQRPVVLVLRGPEGCGKGRLTAELGERAHEQAGYWSMRVRPDPDGLGGLARALSERTGCVGLAVDEVAERLRRHGLAESAESAQALAQLLGPRAPVDGDAPQMGSFERPGEAIDLLISALVLLDPPTPVRGGAEPTARPGLLWLDEPEAEPALLEAALRLLEAPRRPAPLLCVVTLRDQAPESPRALALIERLLSHPDVAVHAVGPLSVEEHEALVRHLIGDDETLVREVTRRTAGNPLFAVQLIVDWLGRGILEEAPQGWRLVRGLPVELPDSLHEVWRPRLERLIEEIALGEPRRAELVGRALELAAIVGEQVDHATWRAVCARARTKPDAAIVEALIGQRLAELNEQGWRFTQPLLRETLQRRAREGGRAVAHHRACATALELAAAGGQSDRVGGHLLAAGDDREALPYLLRAAEERLSRGDLPECERLLDRRVAAMDRAGVSEADVLRSFDVGLRLQLLRRRARFDDCALRAEAAADVAAARGWSQAQVLALLEAAAVQQQLGRPGRAWRRLRQAETVLAGLDDRPLRARCFTEQGRLLLESGRLGEARGLLESVRQELRGGNRLIDLATVEQLLSRVGRQSGALDVAQTHALLALAAFERAGHRWGVASCHNELGEIARENGALDAAEQAYREALRRMDALTADDARVVRINLGILLQERRRNREARPVLLEALAGTAAAGQRAIHAVVQLLLLSAAAAEGNWQEWDERSAVAMALLEDTGFVDVDVARALERAARLARDAGQHARAEAALRAAVGQWRSLGREGLAAAAEGELGAAASTQPVELPSA